MLSNSKISLLQIFTIILKLQKTNFPSKMIRVVYSPFTLSFRTRLYSISINILLRNQKPTRKWSSQPPRSSSPFDLTIIIDDPRIILYTPLIRVIFALETLSKDIINPPIDVVISILGKGILIVNIITIQTRITIKIPLIQLHQITIIFFGTRFIIVTSILLTITLRRQSH